MKTQLYRITLYSILTYLALSAPNSAVTASPPFQNGGHFCGFDDWQPDNRRYARTFAPNLNVGEPRTVRMIYFLPNDRPYRVEVVQRMKHEILNIQTFFAEQMDAHGYGKLTFRFETGFQDEPIVHRMDGQYADSRYFNNTHFIFEEIEREFDLEANIYLIIIDNSGEPITENATGIGSPSGRSGGVALVNENFSRNSAGNLATHELGHAFGLGHDFRDGAYILSYGSGASIGPVWSQLSACHAEKLSVHPYFNPDIPIEDGQSPTIELISSLQYPAGSKSVLIQFKASDSEGLHQVILSGFDGLIECRGIAGEKDALIEFDYNGAFTTEGFTNLSDSVQHRIHVMAVDTDGNVGDASFSLVEISPYHIASLEGHTDRVSSVAFSPVDATLLATGSSDRTVKLWDVETQQEIVTLEGHTGRVSSVAFSPVDATLLATGSSDRTVKLWDVETQQEIVTLEDHTGGVSSVAFSSDGMTLAAGSYDGPVKLWDVATHRDIGTFEDHTGGVSSVAFSSDGMTLAAGSYDGPVKLWDVATHRDIGTFEGHTDRVSSVAFSPVDATLLATGSSDRTVKLWDVETQQEIVTLEDHTGGVSSVAFSRDGSTLATGSSDRTVKLWDMMTLVNFATLAHTSEIYSVAFSSDGTTIVSGTTTGTVELWDTSGLMGVRLEAVAEIDIPDPNLRAAIVEAIGVSPSASIFRGNMTTLTRLNAGHAKIRNLTGLEGATNLKVLWLFNNNISDISAVVGLTKLTDLNCWDNNISDISVMAGLTNLTTLVLSHNAVSDISPLVANTGLGAGDKVYVQGNSLSYPSIYTHIPALQSRGVTVEFDNRTLTRLVKFSGDQYGTPATPLPKPLVVEVQDEKGKAFAGVPVTFVVTAGSGTLSVTSTTTDTDGRAESKFTLGPNLGTNTVSVSAADIEEKVTFTTVVREGVIISDTNLHAAVGLALGKASGDRIVPSEIATLRNLNVSHSGVGDLTGLEFATNLTWLNLGGNNISDISALAGLTNLTLLRLWDNSVSDISAVTGLTNLTTLDLGGNNITDISVVASLTNLKSLDLYGNHISDISAVTGLTNLTTLDLGGNNISDISALAGLTNLTELNLWRNSVSDISALAGLTNLTWLGLEDNNISGISALAGLTNLTWLGLEDNNISDISALAGLTNLTWLGLEDNNISDISVVASLTNLTSLNLRQTNISDISAVAGLTKLTQLNLYTNSASDISPVAGLTNLTSLNLGFNGISDISAVAGLTELTYLYLYGNHISDISVVAGLTELTFLSLGINHISDISAVAGLTNLTSLDLYGNHISDISPLVANTGLGSGDTVFLRENPLSYLSIKTHIPTLLSRGVIVDFNDQAHPALLKISGDNQRRLPGETLVNPFVVEAQDANGSPLAGVSVTFTVVAGGGTLSTTSTMTDAHGMARSRLTLGPNLGTNTVSVSSVGIQGTVTFNAGGIGIPKTLKIISGADQEGLPGSALEKPFVAEVRDQSDKPLPGVEVTFSVTGGSGTLSATITTTDENGRAESTLTLGPNPGTNTVTVSVTGSQETRTFNAEGIRIPKTLEIVSGVDQEGLPGDVLEKPFVVEVRDEFEKPLPGVEVTFTVTAGGGTLSTTRATTDENGRAESTLTLGSTPGTNTVRVSAEGNTQAVASLTIETVRMFALSIPAGTHLIHIPLAVNQINGEDATIETVGDLYNALGDEVNFIITVGDDGGWKTYLGDISTGTVADAEIEDDTGLIVVMSDAKTLELVGDALGAGGNSMINIDVGNNLVGLPLKPAAGLSMISDLLGDGVGAIAVSKADGMGFHTIREPGQDGDAPIVGGVGYLVVYIGTEATSIPIVGSAWDNSGAVAAAPAVAFNGTQTPVLYIEGGVMDEFNMLARAPELRVTVKNLSTGASLDTVLGTELSETAYSGTFVELSRRAAKAGDVLEIVAHSPNPFVGVRPVPQIVVSAEQVLTIRISLPDLELYEIPSETVLLANYPNPFNPETWIPYRLAQAAEVTLDIYDAAGRLVRSIEVGFKPAAVYESRASAIYWDGRNNQGESVASGVYFYHLSAGTYSATRKMLIMK